METMAFRYGIYIDFWRTRWDLFLAFHHGFHHVGSTIHGMLMVIESLDLQNMGM